MIGSAPYTVLEWDWLKLQLRLHVLEAGGPKFVRRYSFEENPGEPLNRHFPEAMIQCYFWCDTTEKLIKKKSPRGEHLEFYVTWVDSEQRKIAEFLTHFPILSKEVDPQRYVLYTVLHGYGMGSAAVCHFYGGKVHWVMSAESVPE